MKSDRQLIREWSEVESDGYVVDLTEYHSLGDANPEECILQQIQERYKIIYNNF